MNNLDKFKQFVKLNPQFASYIKNNTMTWQKFYELYDMYGEDSTIWSSFENEDKKTSPTINDLIKMAKNIDIDKLHDGVNSLSKAVGLFSELFTNKDSSINNYNPRAIYQRFDD